jgi:hypothetical protein
MTILLRCHACDEALFARNSYRCSVNRAQAHYKSLIFLSVRLPCLSSLLICLGLAVPWRGVPGKAAYSMCWNLI